MTTREIRDGIKGRLEHGSGALEELSVSTNRRPDEPRSEMAARLIEEAIAECVRAIIEDVHRALDDGRARCCVTVRHSQDVEISVDGRDVPVLTLKCGFALRERDSLILSVGYARAAWDTTQREWNRRGDCRGHFDLLATELLNRDADAVAELERAIAADASERAESWRLEDRRAERA